MIIVYNKDIIIWLITRFIDIGETALQNVADLITTNSKASDEIFRFQHGTPPHSGLNYSNYTYRTERNLLSMKS